MNEPPIILVVDDNPGNLSVLFEYLEESGFEAAVAQTGENALRQIDQVQPDIILLDVLLPGIDGFETCRRLKANQDTKEIPIIFMTALTEEIDKVKGFLAGGADYITKPFHHEEVLVRINAHLRIRRLQQQMQQQQQIVNQQRALIAQKDEIIQNVQQCRDAFFWGVSQELQHPLNSLLGFARLIDENAEDYSREEIKNNIQRLRSAAEKLSVLHENLVLWLKIQQDSLEFTPEPVLVDEVVAYNLLLLSSNAAHKSIALNSELEEKTQILADYNLLNVIIRNLLSNALQLAKVGSDLNISARKLKDTVEISLLASNIDIQEKELSRILHIFSAEPDLTKICQEADGLELVLCKTLVHKNGGNLTGEYQADQGLLFTCHFPQIAPEA